MTSEEVLALCGHYLAVLRLIAINVVHQCCQCCAPRSIAINVVHHNWCTNVPVVLSRVRTLKGLYMRKALNRNLSKYKVPEKLTKMLERMRQAAPAPFTDSDYEQILKYE